MYRVTRTIQVTKKPPRFETAAQPFETLSEAEVAYVRACRVGSTWRVCLDIQDGERWKALAVFEL